MIRNIEAIIGISIILVVFLAITIPLISAQTSRTSKMFECDSSITGLDAFTYRNGRPLSYTTQGCPIESLTIDGWNDIDELSKESIINLLIANGLKEKDEFNNDTKEIIPKVNATGDILK